MKRYLLLLLIFCFAVTWGVQAQEITAEHLDKNVPAKRILKLDFLFAGWQNQWAGQSVAGLLQTVRDYFGNTGGLADNMNWFTSEWPQATEILANEPGSPATVYQTSANTGNSYYVDEYGHIVNSRTYQQTFSVPASYEYTTMTFVGRPDGTGNLPSGTVIGERDAIAVTIPGRGAYKVIDAAYVSPIVLDLDGDGKLEASDGRWLPHVYGGSKVVPFDINGDGFAELTEWVGPNDGLLVAYHGQKELTGRDLFGDCDGFVNGYEKLSMLDKNQDKKLTGSELSGLSVWQDKNSNARVDSGEILALDTLGITEISLKQKSLVSSFVQNGKRKSMWDWYPCFFMLKKTK